MIGRVWEWAKPKLAICLAWGLLIEGIGSWRAGHWLDTDEWVATEEWAVNAAVEKVYLLVTAPFGGTKEDLK